MNTRDELLAKCKDGEKRYNTSSLFRVTIDSILHGHDQIVIIDNLMRMVDEAQEISKSLIMSHKGYPKIQYPTLSSPSQTESCPRCGKNHTDKKGFCNDCEQLDRFSFSAPLMRE